MMNVFEFMVLTFAGIIGLVLVKTNVNIPRWKVMKTLDYTLFVVLSTFGMITMCGGGLLSVVMLMYVHETVPILSSGKEVVSLFFTTVAPTIIVMILGGVLVVRVTNYTTVIDNKWG